MNKRKKKRSVQLVNGMLLIILAVVFVSGVLLHPFSGVLAIKILHKLSSLLLVVGVMVHILQHRSRKES